MASSSVKKFLYNFQETRFLSLSHELRVFIYGADVTPWLKGELSVTYGNRDSFNSCTFELANPRKLWQLTRANLEGTFRTSIGEYSEKEKMSIFRWKNATYINPSFTLDTKSTILGQRSDDPTPAGQQGEKRLLPRSDNKEYRYRLAVNDCVFSRQDPLRIFMRNPYSSDVSEWIEIFCGFVHDFPVTTNYLTGESTVRVSGYCIRQLLTKMRVQMTPIVAQLDTEPLFEQGFFADFMRPGIGSQPFSQTALEPTIKELILGTATPTPGKNANGCIGEFKLGNVVCYNPNTPTNTLERWHLLTLFGVNKVPFPKSADDNLFLTTTEMEEIGRTTIYLPETYGQSPAGRYLHFLLPFEGTGAGSLVQSTAVVDPGQGNVDWTTRWEIIRDFASKLDFQVTTSPSGDILVEFPMYGFTPHLFSPASPADDPYENLNPLVQTAAGYAAEAMKITKASSDYNAQLDKDIDQRKTPVGLGSLMTFDLHQIEDTMNDEAEDFDTIIQIDGGNAFSESQVPSDGESLTAVRAYVYSPVLVGRYGVVTGQLNVPFAGQNSSDTSGGAESDMSIRLARLGLVEYMKRMANSSSWDGSVVFRPFLFPNRPVWLKRSNRIGLLTSVTNRWTIGKSASTSISVNMLMAERYDPNATGKQTTYRLPTGSANQPIDYANIWGKNDKGSQYSGVFTAVGANTPPTTAPADKARAIEKGTPPTDTPSNIPIGDPTFMYKPFSDAISAALAAAQKVGLPPISIVSTYRDPAKQLYLKNNPQARAKKANGDPVQAAEPWRSAHQFGMAVDIKIQGNNYNDYQKFAKLCGTSVFWGAGYNGDYVHYEWRMPGTRGGNVATQANRFRIAEGYPDTSKGTDYLHAVWKHFDSMNGTPTDLPQEQLKTKRETQTATSSSPNAEACTPAYLGSPGLDTIKSVAQSIAGIF